MIHRAIFDRLKQIAVVPIIRTSVSTLAVRAADAVFEGGIPCVEMTMTVDGAIDALEAVADQYGDRIVLGAGTVLDPETARDALCRHLGVRTLEGYGCEAMPAAVGAAVVVI